MRPPRLGGLFHIRPDVAQSRKFCTASCAARRSEHFLKMKTGQAAARLLGGHVLGNFGSYNPKFAVSIESIGRFLNLSCAYNHLCESERTSFCLRTIEHALCNTQA